MDIITNEIWTIKLNSGEELIAKVTETNDSFIIVKEPVSVAPGPQGIGLIPSLFTADPDRDVRLNTSSIAIVAQTDESVKAKYIQATSGIIVPDKKIIMG